MKVTAAIALLLILAAAAPTAPVEERTFKKVKGLVGGLLGGIFGGWGHSEVVGQRIGTCDAGSVTYVGYHDHREWYRWGNQQNPAPLAYCIGDAHNDGKNKPTLYNREQEEKRTLLLALALIGGLKSKIVKCFDGKYEGHIHGGKWVELQGRGPFWINGHSYRWHGYINGIPYYRCGEDQILYPIFPCQGQQDPGVTVDPSVDDGLCNVCNADALD